MFRRYFFWQKPVILISMRISKKQTPILVTILFSLLFLSGCNSKQNSKSSDTLPQYRRKIANKYTKRANQALAKGKITEASVYFQVAKEQGKKSNPLQKSLNAWLQASNLERDGKYNEALKIFQEIKPTKDKQFNQVLSDKIRSLKQIVQNQQKFQQIYQNAMEKYQKKDYQVAIEQLKTLLRDPTIKNPEYLTIFGKVHDLLLTATIDLANANLAAQNGKVATTSNSNNNSTNTSEPSSANSNATTTGSSKVNYNADSTGASKEPPKLNNGKQVTATQIETARKQIDALNMSGIKASFFSGSDIVKIINISQKNQHHKITKADLEEFLKPNK